MKTPSRTRQHFWKNITLALAASVIGATVFAASSGDQSFLDESQEWSSISLKVLDKKPVTLTTYAEARFADEHDAARLWLVSERFGYAALRNLLLGVNYTFLHYRQAALAPVPGQPDAPWINQHRLEFEINPHWESSWAKLALRNRLEIRWTDGAKEADYRSRHRLELTVPVSKRGPLESLLVSNEVFYDYSLGELNEDRLIPLGTNWRLAENVSLRVYYMERFVKTNGQWSDTHVLGTMLLVNF